MPSAAILMGGQATRFAGADKGALVVDGQSILERQLAILTRLSDDIMLVGGPSSAGRSQDASAGLRHVPDRLPDRGPLAGLDAALAEAQQDPVIVIACDMPFVTADLLAHLAALVAEPTDVDAAVPSTGRGSHPLCAAYAWSCRPAVTRCLAKGRLAVRGLLDHLRVRSVSAHEIAAFGDPHRLLANINTPDEYAALLRSQHSQPSIRR